MTSLLANPSTDVNSSPIPFPLDLLLLALQPLTTLSIIGMIDTFILRYQHMLFFTRSKNRRCRLKGFVIIRGHESGRGDELFTSYIIVCAYLWYFSICARNFSWYWITSGLS